MWISIPIRRGLQKGVLLGGRGDCSAERLGRGMRILWGYKPPPPHNHSGIHTFTQKWVDGRHYMQCVYRTMVRHAPSVSHRHYIRHRIRHGHWQYRQKRNTPLIILLHSPPSHLPTKTPNHTSQITSQTQQTTCTAAVTVLYTTYMTSQLTSQTQQTTCAAAVTVLYTTYMASQITSSETRAAQITLSNVRLVCIIMSYISCLLCGNLQCETGRVSTYFLLCMVI